MPAMVWSHSFVVRASMEAIYRYGLSADRWFTFYPSYAGLAAVEGDWPEEGSVIHVRYKIVGPWTMTLRQEVVAHERSAFIEFDERGLGNLWLDSPRFDFSEQGDGTTKVTLTVKPDSAYVWFKPVIWLVSQPFKKITPRAMKSFAASIEAASG